MDGSIPLASDGELGPTDKPFIFIHSSYRTSSTWFWNKFRQDKRTLAFYEVFHEAIKDISVQWITQITGASWNSNHPSMAPYFLEYLPLIREGGGVEDYLDGFA